MMPRLSLRTMLEITFWAAVYRMFFKYYWQGGSVMPAGSLAVLLTGAMWVLARGAWLIRK